MALILLRRMGTQPEGAYGLTTKISVIAVTAVTYAIGKAMTAFVPTPWGIGQLLIGLFLPAFFALTCDTLSAAVGAGLGTFIGDVIFLTPLGETTPILSIVAGVPANFVAFLLFGWFVKKYRSWPAFVGATVSFVTLGNLIAGNDVVLFLKLPISLIFGFTVFWDTAGIPAVIIGVPVLVRAVRPLFGRTKMLVNYPDWGGNTTSSHNMLGFVFAALFVVLGVAFFVFAPPATINTWPGLSLFYAVAAALVIIFVPLAGIVAGSKLQVKRSAG